MCDGVGNAADYQLVVVTRRVQSSGWHFMHCCFCIPQGKKNPTARGTQYMVYIQQASVFACNDLVGIATLQLMLCFCSPPIIKYFKGASLLKVNVLLLRALL